MTSPTWGWYQFRSSHMSLRECIAVSRWWWAALPLWLLGLLVRVLGGEKPTTEGVQVTAFSPTRLLGPFRVEKDDYDLGRLVAQAKPAGFHQATRVSKNRTLLRTSTGWEEGQGSSLLMLHTSEVATCHIARGALLGEQLAGCSIVTPRHQGRWIVTTNLKPGLEQFHDWVDREVVRSSNPAALWLRHLDRIDPESDLLMRIPDMDAARAMLDEQAKRTLHHGASRGYYQFIAPLGIVPEVAWLDVLEHAARIEILDQPYMSEVREETRIRGSRVWLREDDPAGTTLMQIKDALAGTGWGAWLLETDYYASEEERHRDVFLLDGVEDDESFLDLTRTNGDNAGFYYEELVPWVDHLRRTYGLCLLGGGMDWFSAAVPELPDDLVLRLAGEILDRCPDTEYTTEEEARDIVTKRTIFCWWD